MQLSPRTPPSNSQCRPQLLYENLDRETRTYINMQAYEYTEQCALHSNTVAHGHPSTVSGNVPVCTWMKSSACVFNKRPQLAVMSFRDIRAVDEPVSLQWKYHSSAITHAPFGSEQQTREISHCPAAIERPLSWLNYADPNLYLPESHMEWASLLLYCVGIWGMRLLIDRFVHQGNYFQRLNINTICAPLPLSSVWYWQVAVDSDIHQYSALR